MCWCMYICVHHNHIHGWLFWYKLHWEHFKCLPAIILYIFGKTIHCCCPHRFLAQWTTWCCPKLCLKLKNIILCIFKKLYKLKGKVILNRKKEKRNSWIWSEQLVQVYNWPFRFNDFRGDSLLKSKKIKNF